MIIYVSGRMSGVADYNFPAFNAAAAELRAAGHIVLNPAESFDGDQTLPYETYMREDVRLLLMADAIAMLPGWRESQGARFELLIAQKLGLKVLHAPSGLPYKTVPRVETVLV